MRPDALAGSPEFVAAHGRLDGAGFVDLLYRNALGRAADPAGRAAWTSALAGGASLGSVAAGFCDSREVAAAFVGAIAQNGIPLA